jgi:hypothetical protein
LHHLDDFFFERFHRLSQIVQPCRDLRILRLKALLHPQVSRAAVGFQLRSQLFEFLGLLLGLRRPEFKIFLPGLKVFGQMQRLLQFSTQLGDLIFAQCRNFLGLLGTRLLEIFFGFFQIGLLCDTPRQEKPAHRQTE